jgi:peroxiredoxin
MIISPENTDILTYRAKPAQYRPLLLAFFGNRNRRNGDYTAKSMRENAMYQNIEDNNLNIGDVAPDFSLPGVDGRTYSLESFAQADILVVMFTCNHCPYVQAYEDRLIAIQRDYLDKGVRLVAINSNDERGYPEDGFEHMVERSRKKGFNFPYLRDKGQETAQAYGAQCTPELFLFDSERRLRYHGRVDDNWKFPLQVTKNDLRDALDAVLQRRPVGTPENQAIGCSLKWAL